MSDLTVLIVAGIFAFVLTAGWHVGGLEAAEGETS